MRLDRDEQGVIVLFTCATTRAIHLELVPNISAEHFLRALILKGSYTLIASDNGTTFKDSRVQAYCQREGIKCRFIVEAAPRWEGFFEWMVKSVKLSLNLTHSDQHQISPCNI